jgi:hypothetical protein
LLLNEDRGVRELKFLHLFKHGISVFRGVLSGCLGILPLLFLFVLGFLL